MRQRLQAVFIIAPIIALSCALMSIAVVPFGAEVRFTVLIFSRLPI